MDEISPGALANVAEPRALTIHRVSSPEQRAELIAQQIYSSIRDPKRGPFLRQLVIREMLRGAPDHSPLEQARAIYRWHKANLRYIEDPDGLDWFPEALLSLWQGGEDCDGHTIAVGAALAIVGFQVAIRIVHTRRDEWHVYPLVGIPKDRPRRWVAADTTWPGARDLGDELPISAIVPGHEWTWPVRLD